MAGQLVLGLTILVGLHELGHMLTAKWFGMRVEKYAIGFPPKVFSKQIGETEYMLGAVPLGGFVKISGMIDESMDTAAMAEAPKPYEFRSKPAWQRLIVMMGGIIVNVLTGILIYIILTYKYGEAYLPAAEAKYGIAVSKEGKQIGLQDGDKIVKVNGKPIQEFDEIYNMDVLMDAGSYYTVERGGQLRDVPIPPNLMELMSEKKKDREQALFAVPRETFAVEQVVAGSAAAKAGLKSGDQIVKVGDRSTQFFHELQAALLANAGKPTKLEVIRNGKPITLQANVQEDGTLGFIRKPMLNYATRQFTLAESIPKGTEQAFNVILLNIKGFGKIFRGEVSASKSLSGPIGIAQVFGDTFNWVKFWTVVAMLSMVLAFMNFLPIPALDGGHVMFLTYEMVTGQKPSDKFLENAQKVGMVLLLGLMAFAIFNDVFKLFA